MLTLLKNCHVYAPEDRGLQDIFLANDKIAYLGKGFDGTAFGSSLKVLDVQGAAVVPGFIDQHVHIIGGGGEGSFKTRTPEVMLSDLTLGGTTTVVGVLGTDDITRSMESLLAKANGLEEEGISTWIYTGAYPIPTPTLTGSVRRDLVLISKVLGTGEIAMSDHRNGCQTKEDFARLAAEARVGGLLAGKAGVLHIHVGPGPKMIDWIFDLLAETDLPISTFTPTHMCRSRGLLEQGIRFAKMGGMVDFTAPEPKDHYEKLNAIDAVKLALDAGVPVDRLTLSSDGNGSMPKFDAGGKLLGLTAASPRNLHACLRSLIKAGILPLPEALRLITTNVAFSLKLSGKGRLAPGYDGDLVVLDEDYQVEHVFAKGQCMVLAKQVQIKGTFER